MDSIITVESIGGLEVGNTFTLAGVYSPRKWWMFLMFWKKKKLKRFKIESTSGNLITYQEQD